MYLHRFSNVSACCLFLVMVILVCLVATGQEAAAPQAEATQFAPFLEINNITASMWAGQVSAAMEAMRLVQGEMTPQQTRDFEAAWAPMQDFPFEEGVAYLNRLNPLLGQFLTIRAAMAQTSLEFDAAWQEATTAAAMNLPDVLEDALEVAYSRKNMLASLSRQMNDVTAAITALGDPPNPLTEKARRRKAFKDMVAQARKYAAPKEDEPGAWVFQKRWVERTLPQRPNINAYPNENKQYDLSSWEAELKDNVLIAKSVYPANFDSDEVMETCLFRFSWEPLPLIMTMRSPKAAKRMCRMENLSKPGQRNNMGTMNVDVCMINRETGEIKGIIAFAGGYAKSIDERTPKTQTGELTMYGWQSETDHDSKTGEKYDVDCLVRIQVSTSGGPFNVGGARWCVYYLYSHDPDAVADDDTNEAGAWPPPKTETEGGDQQPGDIDETEKIDPAVQAEQIAFYEANIVIIKRNMEKDRQELSRETDPDRRSELARRLMYAQADIQAEQDRIDTIKTGQLVHTRTTLDEVLHAQFVNKCREEVNNLAAGQRYSDGIQRMARLLKGEDGEKLREFINRNLDAKTMAGQDMSRLKKLTQIVCNKVQGSLEQDAAKAEEAAIDADRNLAYVQSIKTTCDRSMFVLALGGGHGVMVAYQGATGFIEGPPPTKAGPQTDPSLGARIFEGVKRGAAWYNTATFVASEAMEGYVHGGYIGSEKGVAGAVERACEAFLLAKTIEYGCGKIFGTPPKAGEMPKRPTVKEQFQLAEYKQKLADGASLVDDYARTYKEYQRVTQFGGSAAEIAAMERQLQQKAASLNSCMESKLLMKQMQKQGQNASAIDDFIFRMGQNHAEAEKEFIRIMQERGYKDADRWLFRDFRNSASAGSVGMDYDKGVLEEGMTWVKDGCRVSTSAMNEDAQKAWNEAYHRVTGRNARTSGETFTTSANKESYKDLAWLGDESAKHVNVGEIKANWAGQAADVTAVKAGEMMSDPALSKLQGMVEASRGTAKDIDSKLIYVLEEASKKFPKNAPNINKNIEKWKKISEILQTAGENPIEANRRLRLLTGHDLPEIVHDMRDMMANFGKAVGK